MLCSSGRPSPQSRRSTHRRRPSRGRPCGRALAAGRSRRACTALLRGQGARRRRAESASASAFGAFRLPPGWRSGECSHLGWDTLTTDARRGRVGIRSSYFPRRRVHRWRGRGRVTPGGDSDEYQPVCNFRRLGQSVPFLCSYCQRGSRAGWGSPGRGWGDAPRWFARWGSGGVSCVRTDGEGDGGVSEDEECF